MVCNLIRQLILLVVLGVPIQLLAQDHPAVKETVVSGPHEIQFKIRMEGPYTAETDLQVVCYFKYSPEAVAKMKGAPVELDKELGGVIASVRESNQFVGERLETILFDTRAGTIPAKHVLLVGLGTEDQLSLELMESVGRTALRTAAMLQVSTVAFAPLLRDQGNDSLATGKVEEAVIRGVVLAYETEKRLQAKHFRVPYELKQWSVEAGPKYFDETVVGVKDGLKSAQAKLDATKN